MNKYSNGKIYQILNHKTDDIYIGSTCNPLTKRFYYHKSFYHDPKSQSRKLYAKMTEIGLEHFYIELVEDFECESKEQLRAREGFFIRERATLNHMIEGRTRSEYLIEEKDKVNETRRRCYYNRIEQPGYVEKRREASKIYRDENHEHVLNMKKAYRDKCREEINEKQNEVVICECGCESARGNLSRHHKSKMHQSLMAKLHEQTHQDALIEQPPNKTLCKCGCSVSSKNFNVHIKGGKHLKLMSILTSQTQTENC